MLLPTHKSIVISRLIACRLQIILLLDELSIRSMQTYEYNIEIRYIQTKMN